MVELNISLAPEVAKIIQHQVDIGRYSNASEAVADAICQFNGNEETLYQLKKSRLRELLTLGAEQAQNGDFVDFNLEAFLAEENNTPHVIQ